MSVGRYHAYSGYKPTGADWLTSVPKSWSVFDGKRIFESCREPALSSDEQLAASQKFGVVPQSLMMELNDAKVMLALKGTSSFRHVEKHDYVISLRSFEGGIEYSAYTGCVSPAYTVLRPTKPIASGFYKHLFKSRPYISALQATTDSLRDGKAINYEQFGAIPLILPPLPEQTQIAAFLDHETVKIDRLIEKQQALISLLKEKRQAVISHAVTKGLNPHAPLKDSGIEWLGQVPSHWEVLPLRYLVTKIEQGWSPQCENRPAEDNEWGVLKVGCGNRDQFDPNEQKALPSNLRPETRYEVKAGDILVSRGNSLELVGMATFIEQVRPCLLLSDLLYRFQAKPERADGEFLVSSLRSPHVRFQIESEATGTSASMKKIGQENIRDFIVAIPPLDEQRAIVSSIKAATAKLDILTADANKAVTLLQERRTALISAAVTGKIDVRHWQPPADNAA